MVNVERAKGDKLNVMGADNRGPSHNAANARPDGGEQGSDTETGNFDSHCNRADSADEWAGQDSATT